MKSNNLLPILLTCIFLLNSAFAENTTQADKIHSYLKDVMNRARDYEKIPVYIVFNQHLTLQDFDDISYDTPKKERRQIVVNRLMNFSNNYQSRVRNYLQALTSANAENIEIIWLINVIALSADVSVINNLAESFDEIKQIFYDPHFPVEMLYDEQTGPPFRSAVPEKKLSSVAPEPGIILMNADDCWALGNKGKGVIVANSDDGFYWRHPDLVRGIWNNLGEDANNNGYTVIWQTGVNSLFDPGDINGIDNDGNGKIDDLIGWDFTTNNYNISTAAHGSATMGHVVGDGTGGTQTGVSPESKGICMRNSSGQSQQWLAFQYGVLMGADIITSSLSWKWYFNPKPDYSQFRLATDMSLAAGVIHTNSTSNDGNSVGIPLNISTAGNCPAPWRHPDQLRIGNLSGVIGVGNVDVYSDVIASSSPWGPATWGNWSLWGTYTYTIDPNHMDYPYSRVPPVEIPDSMGLLKPDISAPGQGSI
ncbi:MAG: S8 family serine peptidase, partial [Ignavibacteria bacterium]